MATITESVPSMLQGMTQQSSELRNPTQADLQLNAISHPTYGLGKRSGTDHVRIIPGLSSTNDLWAAWISRDDQEKYLFLYDGTQMRVMGLDGREYPIHGDAGCLAYLNCNDRTTDLTSMTLGDTTLVLNRTKTVAMKSSTSSSITQLAVVWINSGNYGQTYTVRLGSTDYTHTTSDTDVAELQTSDIAAELVTLLGAASGYTIAHTTNDNWFTIRKSDNSDFTIAVTDSVGGSGVSLCKNEARSFSDLPPIAPDGYMAKVFGSAEESADDYWVVYNVDRSIDGPPRGQWTETLAPGTAYELDETTMPYGIHRLQDDVLGTNSGYSFGTYFQMQATTWDDRSVGDSTTSPDPSFVGKQIKALFLHQNRLGFGFQGNVVMSRSGDLFNFWRKTVTQVLDDDPIDVELAVGRLQEDRVLNISHIVSFSEELLIVGDRAQLSIPTRETLTPRSMQAVLSSSLEADPLCPPVVYGTSMFLPASGGNRVMIRDYFVSGASRVKDSATITSHVPRMMAGYPARLAVCLRENTLIASCTEDRNTLFIYRWLDVNNSRVQASWGVWTIGHRVLSYEVLGSTLWLVIKRPEGPTLESVELEAWRQHERTTFPLLLDRKVPIGVARMGSSASSRPTAGSAGSGESPEDDGGGGGDDPPAWQPDPSEYGGSGGVGIGGGINGESPD